MSTAFILVFVAAVPFWALMILAPNWRVTRTVTSTPWMAIPPVVFWFIFAIPNFGDLLSATTEPTLSAWQNLLSDPAMMVAIWGQIIAWDLFLGRWIYLDSRARDAHPLAMAPLLVLAILLSPVAVPLYLLLRPTLTRTRNAVPAEPSRATVSV